MALQRARGILSRGLNGPSVFTGTEGLGCR